MNERPDFPDDVPGIDISYQLPLDDGSGRVVVFRSLVPQACTDDEFNEVLDKFSRAAERQKALAVLPTYESDLATKKETLVAETQAEFTARSEFDLHRAGWAREASESGRRNWKPTPTQIQLQQKLEASINQHAQNVRVLEKQIASEEQRLALYKGRLGKGG